MRAHRQASLFVAALALLAVCWAGEAKAQYGSVGTAAGYLPVGTTTVPASMLGVYGGMTIGTSYISTTAPSNGAIIQGNVGIGTTGPTATLETYGTGLFTNGTNSTTAYQFQDASAGNALTVDTTNDLISVGVGGVKMKSNNNGSTGNYYFDSQGYNFDWPIKFQGTSTIYGSNYNVDFITLGAYGVTMGHSGGTNLSR